MLIKLAEEYFGFVEYFDPFELDLNWILERTLRTWSHTHYLGWRLYVFACKIHLLV